MANPKEAVEVYLYLTNHFNKVYLSSTTPQKVEYKVVHNEQVHTIILTNMSGMPTIQSQLESILQS